MHTRVHAHLCGRGLVRAALPQQRRQQPEALQSHRVARVGRALQQRCHAFTRRAGRLQVRAHVCICQAWRRSACASHPYPLTSTCMVCVSARPRGRTWPRLPHANAGPRLCRQHRAHAYSQPHAHASPPTHARAPTHAPIHQWRHTASAVSAWCTLAAFTNTQTHTHARTRRHAHMHTCTRMLTSAKLGSGSPTRMVRQRKARLTLPEWRHRRARTCKSTRARTRMVDRQAGMQAGSSRAAQRTCATLLHPIAIHPPTHTDAQARPRGCSWVGTCACICLELCVRKLLLCKSRTRVASRVVWARVCVGTCGPLILSP